MEAVPINFIFEVNYAAFSIFAALLVTEVMGAVMLLVDYDDTAGKVLDYVIPVWEVTGTFGAFWVVTGDFAFPSLLIPVATIFSPLLIVFLLLFVARNASISFAEFIKKRLRLDDATLYKAYALATLLLGLVVLVLLSALVGGQGVDLASGSFSFASWATPGSFLFLIGTLLLCWGLAPVFFDVARYRRWILPSTIGGVVLSVLSYWLMLPSLLTWWVSIPTLLTLVVGLIYLWGRTSAIVVNKAVFTAVLSLIVFSLQTMIYPEAIGRAIPIDAVTTAGAMVGAYVSITAVGAALLAVMLLLYIRVARVGPSGPDPVA